MDDDLDIDFSNYRITSDNSCECGGTYTVTCINGSDTVLCNLCNAVNDESIVNMDSMVKPTELNPEQRKGVCREICNLNKHCIKNGIRPLDDTIISITIDIFGSIKPFTKETRNKNRRQYLAACTYFAGLAYDFQRSKREIQNIFAIWDRNITNPINTIQMAMNRGLIKIDYTLHDPRHAFMRGVCLRVYKKDKTPLTEEDIELIYKDHFYVLEVITDNILISSNFDSKNLGAVFIALRMNDYSHIELSQLCSLTMIHLETVHAVVENVKNSSHLFTKFVDRYQASNS